MKTLLSKVATMTKVALAKKVDSQWQNKCLSLSIREAIILPNVDGHKRGIREACSMLLWHLLFSATVATMTKLALHTNADGRNSPRQSLDQDVSLPLGL